MAKSLELAYHFEKKPRVPKVAELLPGATLIMPVKPENFEVVEEKNKSPSLLKVKPTLNKNGSKIMSGGGIPLRRVKKNA